MRAAVANGWQRKSALVLALLAQCRSSWRKVGLTLALSAMLMGIVLILHLWKDIPIHVLTSDPVALAKLPAYTGFSSQLGIFLWSASATICWISAVVLAKRRDVDEIRRLLVASGLFSLFLGIDDAFLLHEEAFPSLGIPEAVTFTGYAAGALLYLLRFHTILFKTDYALLLVAFGFLGLSVVIDRFPIRGVNPFFFEDGMKLVGILAWLVYLFGVGVAAIRRE